MAQKPIADLLHDARTRRAGPPPADIRYTLAPFVLLALLAGGMAWLFL